jgi:hypothetical protein
MLVTKESKSTQNGKNISRKGAKVAKKILRHGLVLNQKDIDSGFPLRSLRLCERRLLDSAFWFRLVRVRK